ANLLLYATNPSARHHDRSLQWLEERLHGTARVGLPWPSLLAFLRIATHPRVFPRPLDPEAAWEQVETWLGAPPSWIPLPTERHAEVLANLLIRGEARGNLVPDAHLAALAIEHGLVLHSADRGFARFPDLRFENPLNS
ncbi:MAG: TA system VapC family ribonuclease toxin, partial [Gemmatimonadota bacterium]|nr:TA system VapC family ribonuclease toxin [Gemmatimonadota bacterium]